MYSDKPQKEKYGKRLAFFLAALLLLAAVLLLLHAGKADFGLDGDSAAAIRAAVQRSALQCYAVEGVYPPNLQYLEDNYGLQINEEDFYVSYEAFASNLPPSVRVVKRG